MTDMVDLDVTRWCNTVYDLQREVEEAPRADDVSRGDYRALAIALRDLYGTVAEKLTGLEQAS